jgi:hypothetical protein
MPPGKRRAPDSRAYSAGHGNQIVSRFGNFPAKEGTMPNILHEFYTLTKGMEYLVLIIYLFVFISFWRFLTYKDKD